MTIWLDAQISPAIADWINAHFRLQAVAVRDLGLRDASDVRIFNEARSANAVVLTKDSDFVLLLERLGPPPQIIWLTCGNCSNAYLQTILSRYLTRAIDLLSAGNELVEIS
jgi:predicted nuclease of predicted toxin-antitoxin system